MNFEIRGKWWILSNGIDVIDCSASEHAFYARARMLETFEEDAHHEIHLNTIFSRLGDKDYERHQRRHVPQAALDFLRQDRPDPRVYAIREYGWIRTVDNAFYALKWDKRAIAKLLNCEAFWSSQKHIESTSWAELHAIDDWSVKSVRISELLKECCACPSLENGGLQNLVTSTSRVLST